MATKVCEIKIKFKKQESLLLSTKVKIKTLSS